MPYATNHPRVASPAPPAARSGGPGLAGPAGFARAAALVLVSALATGCAHAEFDLVRPADLAQRIGPKQWVTAPAEPLEYRMIAYEDRLVLQAYNRTSDPIVLLAEQSTVVSPNGQSHPLAARTQTILPGSYAKLILPPPRRAVVPTGPTIGIGFGTSFGSAYHHGRHFRHRGWPYGYGFAHDVFYDRPRYYAVYGGDDESLYWSWPDGGIVRLVLAYHREDRATGAGPAPADAATRPADAPARRTPERFTHEFDFRKVKV